jgi:hypothetical protein
MKKSLCTAVGLALALAGAAVARAQTPAVAPPNILSIETDNIKAYDSGPYDKVAAEYPPVSEQFKESEHYLAMESMTGPPRANYFFRYDSYEAWQKDAEMSLENRALKARFDALDAREAPYVAKIHFTLWHYRPDLSNNVAGADIPHTHYWEVAIFHMRQGHDRDFEELTKIYRDTSVKIGQNTPWATFESLNGVTDAYMVLEPMTSLKDEDTSLAKEKDFSAALGKEGAQRMDALTEAGVSSVEDNIWMVNPAASYVEKSWVDADPKYWGHKPAAKYAPKPAAGAARASKAPAAK